nr:unnamed protein product [Digitaria exilis]
MEQSWLVPFSPRREHTAANVSEPSPHTVPDDLSTAGAAAFPSPAPPSPLLSFPTDSDRARPCSSDEICRILSDHFFRRRPDFRWCYQSRMEAMIERLPAAMAMVDGTHGHGC